MPDHLHEWTWGPWWDTGNETKMRFVCMDKECDAVMNVLQAELCLNATERLGPIQARHLYEAISEDHWPPSFIGPLLDYASALEGSDG